MSIGILTSGGDCPGLNAVIRGAVMKGDKIYEQEFAGIRDGWRGLIVDDVFSLPRRRVRGLSKEGGTILGTSRTHPYNGIDGVGGPDAIRAVLIEGARMARPDAEILEFSPPERAIVEAVRLVGDGDAILWAGPGHQDYRDIRGVRTPYSARELSRRALRAEGWPVPEPRWPVPYPDDETPDSDPLRPAFPAG